MKSLRAMSVFFAVIAFTIAAALSWHEFGMRLFFAASGLWWTYLALAAHWSEHHYSGTVRLLDAWEQALHQGGLSREEHIKWAHAARRMHEDYTVGGAEFNPLHWLRTWKRRYR